MAQLYHIYGRTQETTCVQGNLERDREGNTYLQTLATHHQNIIKYKMPQFPQGSNGECGGVLWRHSSLLLSVWE